MAARGRLLMHAMILPLLCDHVGPRIRMRLSGACTMLGSSKGARGLLPACLVEH